MKKTCFGIIFATAITLFGCGTGEEKNDAGYLTLSVQPNEAIKLSDFAEKIEFIKLANDSLLKGIEQLVIDKNGNMLIRDDKRCSSLQLYAPNGKLICQVGKKGRGPGEYLRIHDIDIDNNKIFAEGNDIMLMSYDMKGNYIPNMPEIDMTGYTNFIIKGDTAIKCYGGSYISFDINGQSYRKSIRKIKIKSVLNDFAPMHAKSHLAKNMDDGTVYWERYYNDTIFEAVGGDIKPFLYVDFGDWKLPEDIPIDDLTFYNEEARKYCADISNFKISNNIISFLFAHKGKGYTCIYNRDTKKQYVYSSLINDINYVPILFPLVQAVHGKKIYFYIAPDMVAQFIEAAKESTEKEHQDMLKVITESLGGEVDEMDNPYIVVVTCK